MIKANNITGSPWICLSMVLACVFLGSCSSKVPERPNIILVITDDQGTGDLGCNGNPYIRTPGIDEFSAKAVSFTNFHVSTTCAPTRGALMTGRHTNRLNVFHTISGRSLLFEDEVLIPEVLLANGYTCGMFGKWHLGDNHPFRPEDRGFDEVVRHGGGGITQGPDYWGNDYFDDHYWHNGVPEKYEGYCTDVFFNEAIRFIERSKNQPFFCYISTNAPHGPLNVPAEYLDIYENEENIPAKQKRFYGMITNIDDNFKRLQLKMDELGLTENTILIFMTDNGTAGGHRVYDGGLRGHKGSVYEGGHRVPFIIRWPDGQIAGGRKVDELVAHYDLLPTLVDMLNLDFKENKALDGTSIKALLKGDVKNWPSRVLYMDTQRLQNLVKGRNYTVMDSDWRLVNGNELYNVTIDLGQENNVIQDHPEVVAKLSEGYEKWWSSIMSEGPNERYAYIRAGTKYENPLRVSAHDLLTAQHNGSWHQYGAATAAQASGRWKIEIASQGTYSISLRRFPRESGLAIDAEFPAVKLTREFDRSMPASRNAEFNTAFLSIADFNKTVEIQEGQDEVLFRMKLPEGKFDMEARFIDQTGRVHPSYYVYIEKL